MVAQHDRQVVRHFLRQRIAGTERLQRRAVRRRYPYYDPISTLPEAGQQWWANRSR